MTVVNILIGMVVGAAVVWFLIAPAVNQTKSSTKNRNVIALSEQIASQKTQIQTLKDELEGYRNSSDEVESAKQTAASTQDSYDALIKVYQQYYGGTTSNADMADTLLGLNRDSLGEEGQKIYDSISGSVFPRVCVSLYSTAQYEVQSGNYDDAISDLEKIQKMDDSYSDGGVYKLLGDAYAGKGDKDKEQLRKSSDRLSGNTGSIFGTERTGCNGIRWNFGEYFRWNRHPGTIKYKRHKRESSEKRRYFLFCFIGNSEGTSYKTKGTTCRKCALFL
jgi:tetratricopeptide (TPR) repeat protein